MLYMLSRQNQPHACLQFQSVCNEAVECWWEDQHPEWTIFSMGGQHFETLGQIIAFGRDGARSGVDNPVVSLPAVGAGTLCFEQDMSTAHTIIASCSQQ